MSTSRIHYIKQNALGPSPRQQIVDDAGNPKNLTGYTAKFTMQPIQGGALTINAKAAVVETGTQGFVRYDPSGTDTATAGRFRAEWDLFDPSNNPVTLPTMTYLTVIITPTLPL